MSAVSQERNGPRFNSIVDGRIGHTTHRLAGRNLRIANLYHARMLDEEVPGAIDHAIVFHYKGNSPVKRYYGAIESGLSDRLRTVAVLPAFRPTRWRCEGSTEVLHFYLDDAVLRAHVRDTLDIDPAQVELRDDMGATDPFIAQIAPTILKHVRSPEPVSQLMVDGFEQLLTAHLIKTYSNLSNTRPRSDGKLDAKTVARIYAHIAANLDDRLSLADLAAYTSMSVFEFARAFKAATGTSPHQALLERRVARVQDLLQNTALSLAEIAYTCGFSSQAHMTTTFAKHMGVTPGRYRKEILQ